MALKNIPTSKYSRIKVGITMGDPSGIGGEIIAASLPKLSKLAQCVVIADKWVFERAGGSGCSGDIRFIDVNNVDRRGFEFGRVRAEYGRASIEYLDRALRLLQEGSLDCLVTCPISKEAIHDAGYAYAGHTEYLARQSKAGHVEMMLLCRGLRFLLATRHLPLKKVSGALRARELSRSILLAYRSLKSYFAVKNPRMVVCGLNPHASDNGVIGDEEAKVIKPAVRMIGSLIRRLDGPLPADTAVVKAIHGEYDCVVAMYHDQALIPLKVLCGYAGVNLTLGLDFVRTSPLHGTAFDIAGKGKADPSSLIAAVQCALECTANLKRA